MPLLLATGRQKSQINQQMRVVSKASSEPTWQPTEESSGQCSQSELSEASAHLLNRSFLPFARQQQQQQLQVCRIVDSVAQPRATFTYRHTANRLIDGHRTATHTHIYIDTQVSGGALKQTSGPNN